MPAYARKHPDRARTQLRLIRPAFITGWRRLSTRPVVSAGMIVMKTCEFAAGAAGFAVGRLKEASGRDPHR
jgi:hypothetical protein